jgi:hypothetical protein
MTGFFLILFYLWSTFPGTMKRKLLLLFFAISLSATAQVKKVLFEEITGALCGNCPSGAWIVDSLTRKYPNLIGIGMHSYGVADAMYFPGIDSLDDLINTQGGAPFGDLDRMHYPVTDAPLYMLFNYIGKFDSVAAVRLAEAPKLTVDILPSWNSSPRQITAQVDIHILSNLPAGDYRVSLYVLEDSVTGSGSGYDQHNFYDTSPPGNPFFGMGDPIVGYVHRHVLRAALPTPLGQPGIIPATPAAGQDYTTTLNYTLPASYNENRVSLVAFVYRNWPGGLNNEIVNAEEKKLIDASTGISTSEAEQDDFTIYPNPSSGKFSVYGSWFMDSEIAIYNSLGKLMLKKEVSNVQSVLINESFPPGIYFVELREMQQGGAKMMAGKGSSFYKLVIE